MRKKLKLELQTIWEKKYKMQIGRIFRTEVITKNKSMLNLLPFLIKTSISLPDNITCKIFSYCF